MKGWHPMHIVVLIATTTICITVLMIPLGAFVTKLEVTETQSKLLSGIITSMVGIVSMYMGAMLQRMIDRSDDDDNK